MIYLGLDRAEAHHDVALLDEAGTLLAQRRVADTTGGVTQIHALVGQHAAQPADVVVGTESVHGLVPQALVAAGYAVYEINLLAASRYRDRHHLAGAKSDRADAKMLADAVRTDRHQHRPFAADSDLAEGIAVLAPAHQTLIHERQTQVNRLRSTLRQYDPAVLQAFPDFAAASERDSRDGLALLERAPTPERGRTLSTAPITTVLRQAGRPRNRAPRAAEIRAALRALQLLTRPIVARAYGQAVQAGTRVVRAMTAQIDALETELTRRFEEHPDAQILRRLPRRGRVLGARVLGEFGDAPARYADARTQELCHHRACDARLRQALSGGGPPGRQPPPRRGLPTVGLLRLPDVAGHPGLLPAPPRPGEEPRPSAAHRGQPAGRDSPHLTRAAPRLRRKDRLAALRGGRGVTPPPGWAQRPPVDKLPRWDV